jgi:hypothetical protein
MKEEYPMKMFSSKSLRDAARLVSSALLLGGLTALTVGCGSDASDPAAVTLDELKAPGNLWIQDNGNGAATLYWTGSNNEADFDGYNVYGLNVGTDKAKLGTYKEGQAIELLDEAGEPVQAAKDFLGTFNYSHEKPLEEAATVTDDGETKFSALPIHQKNGEEGIFPTCGVNAGVCTNHSTSFARQAVSDNSARGVNGTVSYPVSGLTVGQSYCFFILSSMDEGAKVSMTSTNIACVTPRYKSEFSMTVADSNANSSVVDLHKFLETCKASGCATGDATALSISTVATADETSPGPIYIEENQGGVFTPGQNVGVRDLGFYAAGFADPTLPRSAPALVIDTSATNPIINGGGYTPAGRSRKIEKNHVYVFAVPAKDATGTPTSFYYHYIWIKDAVTAGSPVAVEMRISSVLDQR